MGMSKAMVERVTECLLAFEPSILNRSIAERLARAAIEEMREPTEAMVDAAEVANEVWVGDEFRQKNPGPLAVSVDWRKSWRAMIDAALSEGDG
jgi:hypothetical protein